MTNPLQPLLLSGNQAIARGAYESGVRVATGYPGTPATEIVESASTYGSLEAMWSVNEKVALETALGAAFAGVRSMVSMKHVGLNVAADPLFSASYTGINGGMLVIVGDDPSAHSSQNEQDSRHYARAAKLPMLEPSNSQEAKDFVGIALHLSEKYDTPVMMRLTTRVCHTQSRVTLGSPDPSRNGATGFQPDFDKYVLLPRQAISRHIVIEDRMLHMADLAERLDINQTEFRDTQLGIVTSGMCYAYVREAFPEASVLKLGMTYPLPAELIRDFASKVDRLLVIEELDPFLEEHIRALGIEVEGKSWVPRVGELTPQRILASFAAGVPQPIENGDPEVPGRAPRICPGCQYLGIFSVVSKLNVTVAGDIGCYTLGSFAPWNGIDTVVCMGASIGTALGMEKALKNKGQGRILAVIGDGTLLHSGIPALMDVVYNKGQITILILDNSTTAMTGLQGHPGNGQGLQGRESQGIDIEKLCEAIGIEWIRVANPYDMDETEDILRDALEHPGPAVVISRAPCLLIERKAPVQQAFVTAEACTGCGECMKVGCLAVEKHVLDDNWVARINDDLCIGCTLCVQACPEDAIAPRSLTATPNLIELQPS